VALRPGPTVGTILASIPASTRVVVVVVLAAVVTAWSSLGAVSLRVKTGTRAGPTPCGAYLLIRGGGAVGSSGLRLAASALLPHHATFFVLNRSLLYGARRHVHAPRYRMVRRLFSDSSVDFMLYVGGQGPNLS